jgi:hypothetical protein
MADQQSRRTVMFSVDQVVIERTHSGLVAASIPSCRTAYGRRVEVEALIAALRAAIEVSN